jgi:hypothetical protein
MYYAWQLLLYTSHAEFNAVLPLVSDIKGRYTSDIDEVFP